MSTVIIKTKAMPAMARKAVIAAISLSLAALAIGCGPSPKVFAQRAGSKNVAERRAVARDLRGQPRNPKLVPVILQLCADEDREVRTLAFYAISKVDPREEGVVGAILTGIGDKEADVRRAVASSLCALDPFPNTCIPPMIRMLMDPDEKVRQIISTAFIDLEGNMGVASLIRQIDAKDEDLRVAVVNMLGALGSKAKSALPRLKTAAQGDENPDVREAAEKAVKKIEK